MYAVTLGAWPAGWMNQWTPSRKLRKGLGTWLDVDLNFLAEGWRAQPVDFKLHVTGKRDLGHENSGFKKKTFAEWSSRAVRIREPSVRAGKRACYGLVHFNYINYGCESSGISQLSQILFLFLWHPVTHISELLFLQGINLNVRAVSSQSGNVCIILLGLHTKETVLKLDTSLRANKKCFQLVRSAEEDLTPSPTENFHRRRKTWEFLLLPEAN